MIRPYQALATDYDGTLDDPQCTPEDIAYLLRAINASVLDWCRITTPRQDRPQIHPVGTRFA